MSSRQITVEPFIVIPGAAFDLKDVTPYANALVSSAGEFDQLASDHVWGDTWEGNRKTLVVVYAYDDLQMLDIVEENQRMHFIASPPMTILGAAFGLKVVTNKVCTLVKNRSLTVTANDKIFSDGWPDVKKNTCCCISIWRRNSNGHICKRELKNGDYLQ